MPDLTINYSTNPYKPDWWDGAEKIKGVSFAFNFPKPCHVAHVLN